jgi:hypothetical protein
MEVIRKSTIQVECSCCKALLGITVDDVSVNEIHHPQYECRCPECDASITIPSVPRWWIPKLHPNDVEG